MHCKKCDSTNVVKNGYTPAGQQKDHCRDCGGYTFAVIRDRERAAQRELVEKLHRERVSQRGIARVTGVTRPTIIRWLRKKSAPPHRGDDPPTTTRPEMEID